MHKKARVCDRRCHMTRDLNFYIFKGILISLISKVNLCHPNTVHSTVHTVPVVFEGVGCSGVVVVMINDPVHRIRGMDQCCVHRAGGVMCYTVQYTVHCTVVLGYCTVYSVQLTKYKKTFPNTTTTTITTPTLLLNWYYFGY